MSIFARREQLKTDLRAAEQDVKQSAQKMGVETERVGGGFRRVGTEIRRAFGLDVVQAVTRITGTIAGLAGTIVGVVAAIKQLVTVNKEADASFDALITKANRFIRGGGARPEDAGNAQIETLRKQVELREQEAAAAEKQAYWLGALRLARTPGLDALIERQLNIAKAARIEIEALTQAIGGVTAKTLADIEEATRKAAEAAAEAQQAAEERGAAQKLEGDLNARKILQQQAIEDRREEIRLAGELVGAERSVTAERRRGLSLFSSGGGSAQYDQRRLVYMFAAVRDALEAGR